MDATIDILRGEPERLFPLEEMTSMSQRLLGLAPEDVGGASAKGSFARALTERCLTGDRLEALVDVILVSRKEVDPRVRDAASLAGRVDFPSGRQLGEFTIQKKLGESDLATTYTAVRAGVTYTLKVIGRAATRDSRALQRYLTANRLVASVAHEGLPRGLEAGELEEGLFYVAHVHVEGQTLAQRLAPGRSESAAHAGTTTNHHEIRQDLQLFEIARSQEGTVADRKRRKASIEIRIARLIDEAFEMEDSPRATMQTSEKFCCRRLTERFHLVPCRPEQGVNSCRTCPLETGDSGHQHRMTTGIAAGSADIAASGAHQPAIQGPFAEQVFPWQPCRGLIE